MAKGRTPSQGRSGGRSASGGRKSDQRAQQRTGKGRGAQTRERLGANNRGEQARRPRQAPSRGSSRPSNRSDVIVGRREVGEALAAQVPFKELLVTDAATQDSEVEKYIAQVQAAGKESKLVDVAYLSELSGPHAHQGVGLRVAPFEYTPIEAIVQQAMGSAELIVVLDHVTDEGNFGTIVRTAEIVGATGVIIPDKRSASVGVGAYKTSAGACVHLPIAQVTNIVTALESLKAAGFWVAGASEHAENDVWESPLEGRIALVMGSEGKGLSRLVQERCDFLVKLPQRGKIESLNVAQAATALAYEWFRQNRGAL